MDNKGFINLNAFHLAGIIPVAAQPLDYGMAWSDCLMPLAPNYTLIERAIVEATYAGCETIWVVCNDDATPLIKYRIGEWVRDPLYVHRRRWEIKQKKIPVYYIPINPKDANKRDCLAWSILHGANSAYWVSRKLSKWVIPAQFYVAFPFGVYPENAPQKYRKIISSKQSFYLSYNNKTVRDGEYLGFTFNEEEFKEYRRHLRKESTKMFTADRVKLPVSERYSARWFSLDKVFGIGKMEDKVVGKAEWYFNVDSWDKYCSCLGSEERKSIVRPDQRILSCNRKWNPMGVDDDDQ